MTGVSPLKENREEAALVAHEERLYVIGGGDGMERMTHAGVEVFDTVEKQWLSTEPMLQVIFLMCYPRSLCCR